MNLHRYPLIAAALLAGCTTLNQPAVLNTVADVAQLAASTGTAVDLAAHPEHRAAFNVGLAALNKLINDGQYDPAALQAALAKLPLDVLRGPNGALVTSTAVGVFELATGTMFDITTAPAVQLVAVHIRDGVAAGLGTPQTRSRSVAPSYSITPKQRKVL